jgi:hypothetical protein
MTVYGFTNLAGTYTLDPAITVPNVMSVGTPVAFSNIAANGVTMTGSAISFTILGKCAYTTPCGTFSDCIVMDTSMAYNGFTGSVRAWLARGVGPLKIVAIASTGGKNSVDGPSGLTYADVGGTIYGSQ